MRLLLDTHIAYWFTLDPTRLSSGERRLLEHADSGVVFSAVSIWELRLKWESLYASGARKGPASPQAVLAALRDVGCAALALAADDAATVLLAAPAHKDPFDELLLAQAQTHGLRLLTRDRRLLDHPLSIGG